MLGNSNIANDKMITLAVSKADGDVFTLDETGVLILENLGGQIFVSSK